MFDPPDFPYKELSDTLRDQYDSDALLLTSSTGGNDPATKSLAEVTEQMIFSVENQLAFHSNDSGRYFNLESTSFLDNTTTNIEQNSELYIVQPQDSLFNYEPTLLDDNTVNQFLLPLQDNTDSQKVLNIYLLITRLSGESVQLSIRVFVGSIPRA